MATATKTGSKTSNTTKAKNVSKASSGAGASQAAQSAPAAPESNAANIQFNVTENQPAQAPAKPLEHIDSDMQAENAIAAMNMVVRDEERVIIRTPHDPFNQQKLFERSINGLIIVLYADELYSLPKSIAKAIKKQVRIQEISDMTHEEFTTKNGKFIG